MESLPNITELIEKIIQECFVDISINEHNRTIICQKIKEILNLQYPSYDHCSIEELLKLHFENCYGLTKVTVEKIKSPNEIGWDITGIPKKTLEYIELNFTINKDGEVQL